MLKVLVYLGGVAAAVCLAAAPAASQQAQAQAARPPVGPPPEGWSYLPELGQKDIFQLIRRPASGPAPQMHSHTQRDVGILTKETSVPLTSATTLKWRWKMKQLPSKVAEDVTGAHDYFSIAVKFDNGQDLTYMWSAALPVETGFRCPLRNWKDRETHVVVRSGTRDFDKWLNQERHVLADYAKHVGGAPPARITQVWLIANSSIQRTEGDVSYARISVGNSSSMRRRERIL